MERYSIFHVLCSTDSAAFPRAALRTNYARGNQGSQASLAGVPGCRSEPRRARLQSRLVCPVGPALCTRDARDTAARTTAQVRAVLRDLAQQAHVESGPVEQAQEALRLLSQACLPLPWARPWPFHAQAMAAARGGAQGTIRSRRGQLRRGRCGTSGGAAPVGWHRTLDRSGPRNLD